MKAALPRHSKLRPPRLCWVVALPAEARPLVRRYQLRSVGGAFRTYWGEATALTISGVGKCAAAAATAYLYARAGEPVDAVWLNVGIAGHRDRPIGDLVLGEKIRDHGSGKEWLLRAGDPVVECAPILTVDRMEERFETDWVYEMEAAGFYATAIRFSPMELVQCVKVISDRRETHPRRISAQAAENRIEMAIGMIAAVAETMGAFARDRRSKHRKHDGQGSE